MKGKRFNFRHHTAVLVAVGSILISTTAACGKELPSWPLARDTILACYGGWDVEVKVTAGYEQRTYYDGPVDGPFANGSITVPIYSRKERLSRQEQTNKQLEHLASLYKDFQEQEAIEKALSDEKKILRRTMIDAGSQGISAYYDLIKEVEKARASRDSAHRKVLTWLGLCGYNK